MNNIELDILNNTAVGQNDNILFDADAMRESSSSAITSSVSAADNVEVSENNNRVTDNTNTTVVVDDGNSNQSSESSSSGSISRNISNDSNNTTVVVDSDDGSQSSESSNDSDRDLTIVDIIEESNSIVDAGVIEDNFLVVSNYTGDRDIYQFEVTQAGTYEVELGELEANLDLAIEDSEGNTVYSSSNSGNTSELISEEFETGDYLAYVTTDLDNVDTSYSLAITESSDNDSEPIIAQEDIVYRFFDTESETQFYTTSEFARNSVIESLPTYEYEEESFISAPNPGEGDITGVVPVYHFYNTATEAHFYTAEEEQRDFIEESSSSFTSQGIAYYAYEAQEEDSIPVYHFYNKGSNTHVYTASVEERDEFIADSAYKLEGGDNGVLFYVEPIADI